MSALRRQCAIAALILLAMAGVASPSDRPDPFPAYYPSSEDRAAAETALETAAEHLASERLAEAEEAAREATRLIPTASAPFVLLAMVAEQQGRTSDAIDLYREAFAWNPDESRALAALERLSAPRYADVVTQYEDQLLQLINNEREAAGLAALKPHPVCAEVAREHSAAMRDLGFFDHRSPRPGETTALDRFLKRFDGTPQRLGENVSRRWTRPQPALNDENMLLSHAELMMSTGHRRNILKPDFVYVGIGIATNPMGDYWITQLFMTPRPGKDAVMIVPDVGGH